MAAEEINENRVLLGEYANRLVGVTVNGTEYRRALGILGGEVFRALEDVITFAEELRALGYAPLTSADSYGTIAERSIKSEQRRVAELLEHTIRKALEG
jgi:methylaspartate ammonia-lyase